MSTRPLIWGRKLTAANALLLLLTAFAMPVLAEKPATVKVKVELEAGIGGTSGVVYRLYRVQAGCCDECRKPPQRPCRKCGCPIAAAVDSVTLRTSGLVEFKNVPAGTYLIENEVGGKSAGYEAVFKVRGNETMNLGSFTVDSGKPWLFNNDLNNQYAAAADQFRAAAKASDDIAQGISQLIDLKRKLARAGKISIAEESLITDGLLKVNTAEKQFVAQVKALKATPDANGKAALASLFAQVTSALAELNSKGLLPLGNADAKSQLAKILSIATTAAQVIETFLNQ